MTNEEKIINDMVNGEAKQETDNDIGAYFVLIVDNIFSDDDKEVMKSSELNLDELKHIIIVSVNNHSDVPDVGRYDWNLFALNDNETEAPYRGIAMMEYGGTTFEIAKPVDDEYMKLICETISKNILNRIGYHEDIKVTMISIIRFLLNLIENCTDDNMMEIITYMAKDEVVTTAIGRYIRNDYRLHAMCILNNENTSEEDRKNVIRLSNIIERYNTKNNT